MALTAAVLLSAGLGTSAAQPGDLIGPVTARTATTVDVTLTQAVRVPPAVGNTVVFTRDIGGYIARAGEGVVTAVRDRVVTIRITSGRPDLASVARTRPFAPASRSPPGTPSLPSPATRLAEPPASVEAAPPVGQPVAVTSDDGRRAGFTRHRLPGFGTVDLPTDATTDGGVMPEVFWRVGADSVRLRFHRVKVDRDTATLSPGEHRGVGALRRRVSALRAPGTFDLRWEVRRLEEQVAGRVACVATWLTGRHYRMPPRLVVVAACDGAAADEVIRLEFDVSQGDRAAAAEDQVVAVMRSFHP